MNKMKEDVNFFIQGLKKFREVGTITRSSASMCKNLVSKIPPDSKIVVELGAGDGVVTRYILDSLPKDGLLFAFEINDTLFDQLMVIDDPRLIPVHESAENLGSVLQGHNIQKADAIISVLPFILMGKKLTHAILENCKKHLRIGGTFIQVHYAKNLVEKYKEVFGNIKIHKIYKNFPPAYVFTCTNH